MTSKKRPGNPNIEQARQEALKSPRLGKRGKGKKTLKREEAWEKMTEHIIIAAEPMVQAQIKKAKKGDTQAFKDLMDRIFGKAIETVNTNTTGELTIKWKK